MSQSEISSPVKTNDGNDITSLARDTYVILFCPFFLPSSFRSSSISSKSLSPSYAYHTDAYV